MELLFYAYVNNTLGSVVQSGKTFYKQETFIKKSSTEGHINSRPTVKSTIINKCNTPLAEFLFKQQILPVPCQYILH
jgi:hypothetical protein